MMKHNVHFIFLGVIFAALWASASSAAKIGVTVMPPLALFEFRFILAGFVILLYSFLTEPWQWPTSAEWKNLAIFGFLNVTLYLSLFVLAITEVAAGIGSLATSLSPMLMSLIGALFYKKEISPSQVLGLVLGMGGVGLAAFPLLGLNFATPQGLILLLVSMMSYSVAALFYSAQTWSLSRYAINGWQVLFGALFLLPITIYFNTGPIEYSHTALFSILWLAIPVSVVSVNIWLRLLKIDTTRASFFLFLSPIFGFIFASFLLSEPFTHYTFFGLVMVLVGLGLGQRK